ncbi:hypothetical protein ACI2TO_17600 [Ralstonia nicotianae]
MILIWQGLGFLAVLIPLCVSLVGQLAADALFGKGYYTAHHSVFATLMVLSAAAVWHLGRCSTAGRAGCWSIRRRGSRSS